MGDNGTGGRAAASEARTAVSPLAAIPLSKARRGILWELRVIAA
ncbi:hypothetical protein TPCV14_19370 [Cutibacterium avidum]|nr:hypothetical protein TPCV14_19370 [Cutibacterium avidum]